MFKLISIGLCLSIPVHATKSDGAQSSEANHATKKTSGKLRVVLEELKSHTQLVPAMNEANEHPPGDNPIEEPSDNKNSGRDEKVDETDNQPTSSKVKDPHLWRKEHDVYGFPYWWHIDTRVIRRDNPYKVDKPTRSKYRALLVSCSNVEHEGVNLRCAKHKTWHTMEKVRQRLEKLSEHHPDKAKMFNGNIEHLSDHDTNETVRTDPTNGTMFTAKEFAMGKKAWDDHLAETLRKGNLGERTMSHREAVDSATSTWFKIQKSRTKNAELTDAEWKTAVDTWKTFPRADVFGNKSDSDEVGRKNTDAPLPTAANIKRALERNIALLEPGDTFIFAYSGHGGYGQQVTGGHKRPGFDLSCMGKEYLWDKDLNNILNSAKAGVKILVLINACNSAYVAGLPFRFRSLVNSGRHQRKKLDGFQNYYNGWMRWADWYWSGFLQKRQLQKSVNKPFIICVSSSDYYEDSWEETSALRSGMPILDLFLPRMISYMFGDLDKEGTHLYDNRYKSIAHQFYMCKESSKLHRWQHPALTSNFPFDPERMSFWDFLTGDLAHNGRDMWLKSERMMPPPSKGKLDQIVPKRAPKTKPYTGPKCWPYGEQLYFGC